jgi:hypothetical protein
MTRFDVQTASEEVFDPNRHIRNPSSSFALRPFLVSKHCLSHVAWSDLSGVGFAVYWRKEEV